MKQFTKKELDIAAKTVMSMCLDYQMGGLSEEMFRRNLKMFGDRAAQTDEDQCQVNDSEEIYHPTASWLSGLCTDCGYPIVVTQSRDMDYWWYCSNKECKNHDPGEQTPDCESPTFYINKKDINQ